MAEPPKTLTGEQALGLAIVLYEQGRFAEAENLYQAILAHNPDHPGSLHALGVIALRRDAPADALAPLARVVALTPDWAEPRNDLGMALVRLGRHKEALPHFAHALALQPQSVTAEHGLGVALANLDRHQEALAHFARAISHDSQFVPAIIGFGGSLNGLNRPREAAAAFHRALTLEPDSADAHAGLGTALQFLGDLDGGQRALERAVALAADKPSFHRILAETKRFYEDDPQLAAMEALAKNADSFSDEQRINLAFALGKAHDDLRRYETAFGYFLEANSLNRKSVKYDEKATRDLWTYIAQIFTPELVRSKAGGGDPSDAPVFILGMPRSGSTLVEQLLASHPSVFGAGEVSYLPNAARAFRGRDLTGYFPAVAARLSPKAFARFGADYVAKLRAHAPDALRVTDKMPANFRFIGLIKLALPNARIIHTVRDPADTCWSCYTKLFRGAQPFSYDLGELGRYYREYERLMTHWRAVLPEGAMLEVQYEDLIADFEAGARRIVEYCGLPWDSRCLKFHETDRPVRTASATQIRQPVFNSSIGRWKPYRQFLGPLLEGLEDDD
ncbi:MAG TPA: sulfotransferase [Rhizomicrobium sp.]